MQPPADPVTIRPVYLRLRDEIAGAIIDGRIAEGTLLPSVRAYAAQRGVNPLTVAKAYQQFQDDGLVEVRRGIGMRVVAGARMRLVDAERRQFLTSEWPQVRDRIRLLGLDAAALLNEEQVG